MKRFLRRSTLLLCIGLTAVLRADVYNYHPASSLTLGNGFDPSHPTEPYIRKCLDYTKTINIDSTGGTADGDYQLKVISDRATLYRTTHLSASLDASYGFFSANGSTDSDKSFSSSEDSLTWIAQAQVTFGRFQPVDPLANPRITDLSAGDIRAVCGTELVTQETRGVIATITYTFHNLSADQKTKLSDAISASASYFGGKTNVKAGYDETVEETRKHSSLSVQVTVRGGKGTNAIATVIGADSDLTQIRTALQSYITTATEENAAPFQYQTSSISQYYPKVGVPVLSSGRDDALTALYATYLDIEQNVKRISDVTKSPVLPEDLYLNSFVTDKQRKDLLRDQRLFGSALVAIRQQAKQCLTNDTKCRPYDISALPRVKWPVFPEIPEMQVFKACSSGYMSVLGSPPPAEGEKRGFARYRVYVSGNPALFDRVTLVNGNNTTHVQLKPVLSGFMNLFSGGVVADEADNIVDGLMISLGGHCDAHNLVDTTKVFGTFEATFDLRYKTPLNVSFELRDKLGRTSTLHPSQPAN